MNLLDAVKLDSSSLAVGIDSWGCFVAPRPNPDNAILLTCRKDAITSIGVIDICDGVEMSHECCE